MPFFLELLGELVQDKSQHERSPEANGPTGEIPIVIAQSAWFEKLRVRYSIFIRVLVGELIDKMIL